jgi:hypothetical protein
MKEKLLNHVNKKQKLSEKLDFLTALYLRTSNKTIQAICEEVRHELCKKSGHDWFVYPTGRRLKNEHEFAVYKNGHYYGLIPSKKAVKELMELHK